MYDPNFLKGIPIKNRHNDELLWAYTEVYEWSTAKGVKPLLHKMDNENPKEVEAFIKDKQKVKLQYVTPGRHCPPAKKGVQTYKTVFQSVMTALLKEFPIAYWCSLVPHRLTCVPTLRGQTDRIQSCLHGQQWRVSIILMQRLLLCHKHKF